MGLQEFMIGLILGMFFGVAGWHAFFHGSHLQRMHTSSPQEIDRLIEDFQKLFRQIDQGNRPPG
jgi:hypothetical protein